MKYIHVEGLGLLLFSPAESHLAMSYILGKGRKVVSAGFVDWVEVRCFGESVSLQLKATEEDTRLLRAYVAATRSSYP